jgi:phospholipid/cholesterol/gamma-HCH transport system substrate-binding protein
LAELEPSARRLGAFAREATPPVRQLRQAAPAVNSLLGDVEPLADAAIPALERLSRTSGIGRRTVRAAMPVARRLQLATRELPDVVRTTMRTVESLRDTGGVESVLSFIYYATAASARFDSISHMLPAFALVNDCARYAREFNPNCNGHFPGGRVAAGRSRPAGRAEARRGGRRRDRQSQGNAPAAPTAPPTPAAPERRGGDSPRAPRLPELPLPRKPLPRRPGGGTGIPLLDYLLG